jgi:hypothetical protein
MTGSITASFHDLALGRAREKSLKNFGLVPLRWRRSDCVELDPSPLWLPVMPTAQLVSIGLALIRGRWRVIAASPPYMADRKNEP